MKTWHAQDEFAVVAEKACQTNVSIETTVSFNRVLRPQYLVVLLLRIGVTIHKEKDLYVAMDAVTGVASQGRTFDEALRNFQEAFELWFEKAEDWEKKRAIKGEPVATMVIEIGV
jgi:predicted RNase H-like HicB family nuclease